MQLIAITVMNMALYALTYVFYRTINARRQRKWDSMTAKVRLLHSVLTSAARSMTFNSSGTARILGHYEGSGTYPRHVINALSGFSPTSQGNQKLNFRFVY